jgi:4-diphosphocytidyl-2-C-methyl-D-erythritol kinase
VVHQESIVVPAFAKLNLALAVLDRRTDGYHVLASILQTISLHDTLAISPSLDGTLSCEVDDPALRSPDNLVLRAAQVLRQDVGDTQLGARFELRKQIPIQGGLGGGSSDGVAALLALNPLWGANRSDALLAELAATFGSDTAYFVYGGTARIAGRGEIVVPLPDAEPLWFVLAKPPVSIPTAAIFRRLSPADYGDAAETDELERAVRAGERLDLARLGNTLEPTVLAAYPAVAATRATLLELGAPLVRLSGSGPTLYIPYREEAAANQLYTAAAARGLRAYLCRSVGRDEYRNAILGPLAE